MRDTTYEILSSGESSELLTTGEAAKLLNSSRQHVVDLCNRGDLPYLTIGTHRRVRRSDVEAIRTRTERLTRDQRRSLWLAFAIAGKITQEPDRALDLARRQLQAMKTNARGQARKWLEEWDSLIEGPIEEMLVAYTSRSPKGRELRQNAPFAGLLTTEERSQALEHWRAAERDRRPS